MKLKAVLFDLDGTLLPMDLNVFFKQYFKLLSMKLMPYGYDPQKLVETIWQGVVAVEKNDGKNLNEEVFFNTYESVLGVDSREHRWLLDDFYLNEFESLKEYCSYVPEAAKAVKEIKKKGLRMVVATKPIFPEEAIFSRMRWAGVEKDDFEFVTSYKNSKYCKPSEDYYKEILEKLQLSADECLMVGNDVSEDMVAENVGIKVFLLKDCLINTENKDISRYNSGNFNDLLNYIDTLV